MFSDISTMRASSTSDSNTDLAVTTDGDVSTCFSTASDDVYPFMFLEFFNFPYVMTLGIKSRSAIGKHDLCNHYMFFVG